MSIAINQFVEKFLYEPKVDFGMGGIPLGEFILAIVLIGVAVAGWWFIRGRNKD